MYSQKTTFENLRSRSVRDESLLSFPQRLEIRDRKFLAAHDKILGLSISISLCIVPTVISVYEEDVSRISHLLPLIPFR